MWPTIIILIAVIIAGFLGYNSLIRLKVTADGAWSDIDVQLKRRYDLIPNLVEAVKGYAAHERNTLDGVIAARTRAMDAQGPSARAVAESELTGALRSLFALSESYPRLRASENFGQLQQMLAKVEDDIQHARRYYNAVVRDLNTRILQFPSVLVARAAGFKEREFFEIAAGERTVPRVTL